MSESKTPLLPKRKAELHFRYLLTNFEIKRLLMDFTRD
jgi:hypothetical protein